MGKIIPFSSRKHMSARSKLNIKEAASAVYNKDNSVTLVGHTGKRVLICDKDGNIIYYKSIMAAKKTIANQNKNLIVIMECDI